MNNHSEQNEKKGLLSGIGAYLIWGVLPLYWKALGSVTPLSVLSYRIIWSFVFMLVVLLVTSIHPFPIKPSLITMSDFMKCTPAVFFQPH